MKKVIYYILYEPDSEKENSQKNFIHLDNDRLSIHIMKINPYKFSGICGQRCHELCIDAEFQKTPSGREMINSVFKPMACLKDSYIYYI